jgi:hypothetical protein
MNISAFKRSVDALARLASAKTSSPSSDPRSKIGVQVDRSGNLTLIAGSPGAGVLCRMQDKIDNDGKPYLFAVDAKTMLQAAKVLKGKGTVHFSVDDDGLTVNVDGGGSVRMAYSCSLKEADFPPKPKSLDSSVSIGASEWDIIYRMISAIDPLNIEPPTVEFDTDRVHIVAVARGERPCYVRLTKKTNDCQTQVASPVIEFWDAIKCLDKDGTLSWGSEGFLATIDDLQVWGIPLLFGGYSQDGGEPKGGKPPAPWPVLAIKGEPIAMAAVNRTAMIDAIRGVIPNDDIDEYGRITIEIKNNQISLMPFGDESGISFPAKTAGSSTRSIRGEYIVKMLRASVGKEVTLSMYQSPPISIGSPDMPGWTVLVAPVALG